MEWQIGGIIQHLTITILVIAVVLGVLLVVVASISMIPKDQRIKAQR
jgi:hypothetical protein